MRPSLPLLLFVVAFFPKLPLLAQQTQSSTATAAPPVRDTQALTVVQAAITAMGGATAIGQIQSCKIQAQMQGASGNANRSGTLTWEMAGQEFRMESVLGGNDTYIVTGHGNPAFVGNGASNPLPQHVTSTLFIPALLGQLLLAEFQNSTYTIQYQGQKTFNGNQVTVVTTVSTANATAFPLSRQTWFFDNTTNLPVRVEFRVPTIKTAQFSLSGAIDLSNWTPISGVLYPFQIVSSQQRRQLGVITLQLVSVNPTISPTDFDAAAGGGQ